MSPFILAKLNSRRGASMIFALLFFLLCAFVGGVVLTAASVNAGRAARERESRQAYLAVASAASLVKEDLDGLKFNGVYKKITSTTTTVSAQGDNASSAVVVSERNVEGGADTCFIGSGGQLLTQSGVDLSDDYYFTLYQQGITLENSAHNAAVQVCELSFEPSDEELDFLKVSGTLTVGMDYSITVSLKAMKDEKELHSLTMKYVPVVAKPEVKSSSAPITQTADSATETVTTSYITTVTWDGPMIAEGGAGT